MKRNRTGWNSSACIRVCQFNEIPLTSTRPSLRQISVTTTKMTSTNFLPFDSLLSV